MDAADSCIGLTDEERAEAYRFAEDLRATIRAKRRADRAAQMKERVRPSIPTSFTSDGEPSVLRRAD